MEKEFEDYLHKVRNSFVDEVNKTPVPKELGIKIHEFIVAFDQLKWKMRESQNSYTSDEALPIADVVKSCKHNSVTVYLHEHRCNICGAITQTND